eukprot:m.298881 g.298881  ORF g.298881 m.298881 type:complete len:268 (-) comp20101_c0_seq6:204-1007(-)
MVTMCRGVLTRARDLCVLCQMVNGNEIEALCRKRLFCAWLCGCVGVTENSASESREHASMRFNRRTSQSNLEHIKAMFHNGEQQYQLAGGDTYDFAAGDRAYDLMHPNADSDDENEEKMYAMANKEATYDMAATDGAKSGGDADYSLAAGAKESEYDMANRREQSDDEHVYSTASSEPNSESNTAETAADGADVYAMANSKETVPENNSVGGDDHATQTSGDSDRHFTAQDGAIYGLPQKKQSKLGKFLSGFGKKGSSQDVGRKQSN